MQVFKPDGDEVDSAVMQVTIEQRQVFAALIDAAPYLYLEVNDTPTYIIELQNSNGEMLENPGFQVKLRLYSPVSIL